MKPKYKRILIKVSGEALSSQGKAFDEKALSETVDMIKSIHEQGVQLGVVLGGGNIWRGRISGFTNSRVAADNMGMLATAINAVYVQDALLHAGIDCIIMTAFRIEKFGEVFNQLKAIEYLKQGFVVLFACGTGNPFISTDTGAALRAAEIGVDIMFLAKNVDGIYDSDPKINKNAKLLDQISYQEYLAMNLKVMDATAVSICQEMRLKVLLFGYSEENGILRALAGEHIGTLLH